MSLQSSLATEIDC